LFGASRANRSDRGRCSTDSYCSSIIAIPPSSNGTLKTIEKDWCATYGPESRLAEFEKKIVAEFAEHAKQSKKFRNETLLSHTSLSSIIDGKVVKVSKLDALLNAKSSQVFPDLRKLSFEVVLSLAALKGFPKETKCAPIYLHSHSHSIRVSFSKIFGDIVVFLNWYLLFYNIILPSL
jgi:hypothetical protein